MTTAVYRDDNFYLILRGSTYHVIGMCDGKRIRKSCNTRDLARAKLFLENLKREADSGWREDYDRSDRNWREVAELVCSRHRAKAKYRGMPFELKPGEVYALMKATAFRCAVSGIPFAKRLTANGETDPWAPSIDRIENRQGYYMDNVRIVCLAANVAMNRWGHDVLLRLARGVVGSSILVSQEPDPLAHQLISDTNSVDKPLITLVK